MVRTYKGTNIIEILFNTIIMNRKVLLMILDGWGEGKHDHSNAIWTQGSPFIDSLRAKYPFSHLQACGEYVGLPDGQMGNSEVGHMNLGAGRVVYQDLVKINRACKAHKLLDNPEIKAAYDYVKKTGKKVHFIIFMNFWHKPKNTVWRMSTYIALWTVVTPTLAAAKVS